MSQHDEKSDPKAVAKKRDYRSPQLIIYGNIREMTQILDLAGAPDLLIVKTGFPL
jgi:hypothetical protein